jgi:hypothetical protein
MDVFHATKEVPQISTPDEFRKVLAELKIFDDYSLEKAVQCFTTPISIKKLIMLAEMARQGTSGSIVDRFYNIIKDNL